MERLFRFTDKEGYQVENNGCSPYGGEYAQGGDVAQSYYGKPQVAKPVAALPSYLLLPLRGHHAES